MVLRSSQALTIVDPEEMGLCRERWDRVLQHAHLLTEIGTVRGVSLQVQRQGLTPGQVNFGSRSLSEHVPIDDQTRFSIASLTKPMVAMAILKLVEQGQVALNQRISDLVPEFKGPNKRQITVRHVLTHTSGLPDMLPNNDELREANSALMKFVEGAAEVDLVFPCGTNSQYQSMGFALLGPLVENVTGKSLHQLVREEIFIPLEMGRAAFGMTEEEFSDANIADVKVPRAHEDKVGWNWNSRYWRMFGAPWGGVFATAGDVSKFSRCLLSGGIGPHGTRLFHENTIRLATTNRLEDFPDIPEPMRRTRGWGYGWRLNWLDHRGNFGDLLGPEVYGHWGATGTLFWHDPKTETAAVLLSSQPYDRSVSPLVSLSNLICAAFTA